MATSGLTKFSITRNDVIKSVLRLLGVIGVGQSPINEDYTNCSEALNIMIKAWVTKGFPLWTYNQIQVPMIAGVTKYPLGPSAAYIFAVTSTGGSGYVNGTWTAVGGTLGVAASGTYITVGGVPTEFTVVVPGDSYTTQPTSYTLTGAGTGAVIKSTIVGLTIPKPLRVFTAFLRSSQNLDTDLTVLSRQEYDIQGNKFSKAVVNQLYYDPQLVNGVLNVFNSPNDSTYTAYILTQRQLEDMTAATDTFDFPQEWFLAIKWNLAAELSEEYGIEEAKIQRLEAKAMMYLAEVVDFSVEESSVFFTMTSTGKDYG